LYNYFLHFCLRNQQLRLIYIFKKIIHIYVRLNCFQNVGINTRWNARSHALMYYYGGHISQSGLYIYTHAQKLAGILNSSHSWYFRFKWPVHQKKIPTAFYPIWRWLPIPLIVDSCHRTYVPAYHRNLKSSSRIKSWKVKKKTIGGKKLTFFKYWTMDNLGRKIQSRIWTGTLVCTFGTFRHFLLLDF
jgi:hypothetical protein